MLIVTKEKEVEHKKGVERTTRIGCWLGGSDCFVAARKVGTSVTSSIAFWYVSHAKTAGTEPPFGFGSATVGSEIGASKHVCARARQNE